jgi:hypothetical protein
MLYTCAIKSRKYFEKKNTASDKYQITSYKIKELIAQKTNHTQ